MSDHVPHDALSVVPRVRLVFDSDYKHSLWIKDSREIYLNASALVTRIKEAGLCPVWRL